MKARCLVKTFVLFATTLLLLIGITGSSLAAEAKFGKISLAEVRTNSSKIKAALETLQQTQSEALAKIGALKQETDKLQEKLKSEPASLSKEEKEKTETELKDKSQELQTEQQAAKIKLTFQQKSIQNAVKMQINQAIEKIAKEEGISGVFLSEMLLYSEGIVDLTDKVTKAIDAMPAIDTGTQ
jgi:outer membrane protein